VLAGKQVFEHSSAYRLRDQNGRFRVDVMNFSTIQSEGSLISADLLMEIASGTASGQQPADFGASNPTSLNNEIAASWSDARAYWDAFQHGLRRVGPNESGATPTRELWMLPVLRSLGFDGIVFARSAATVGGQS
jgi:hypothetical protein